MKVPRDAEYPWGANTAITPDGLMVVSPVGRLRVWDLATGTSLRELALPDDTPDVNATAVAVSPDGTHVLAGTRKGDLRLWDIASGLVVREWHGHDGPLWTVAFSPDGRRVVSGADDGVAKVWDASTARNICTFTGHQRPSSFGSGSPMVVWGVAFTHDGTRVVSGGNDGEVRVWDSANGEERFTMKSVSTTTDGFRTWTTENRSTVPGIRCLRLAGKRHVLTGGMDGSVALWDLESGLAHWGGVGHTDRVDYVAAIGNGQLVASGSPDKTLRVWGVGAGELYLSEGSQAVRGVEFSADSRYLVSASDGFLQIRDLRRPARYREFNQLLIDARQTLQTKNPNDAASLKVLGEWYAFRGVWEWGVEFLEMARQQGADVSSLTLARCYSKLARPEEAQREFALALTRKEAPEVYLKLCSNAIGATAALDRDEHLTNRSISLGEEGKSAEAQKPAEEAK
jgi:hypothetical protein